MLLNLARSIKTMCRFRVTSRTVVSIVNLLALFAVSISSYSNSSVKFTPISETKPTPPTQLTLAQSIDSKSPFLTASAATPAKPDSKAVVVALSEWPPYISERLPEYGFATDLLKKILQKTEYQAVYKVVSFEQAIVGMKNEKFDLIPALWIRPDREEYMYFSNPYLVGKTILASKSNLIEANEEQFKINRVGLVKGYSYPANVLAMNFKERIYSDEAYQNFTKLLKGEVDFIVSDYTLLKYFLRRSVANGIEQAGQVKIHRELASDPIYFGVRKSYPNGKLLIKEINQLLDEMKTSEQLQTLYINHLNYFYQN